MARRSYDSSARQEAARLTRARILETARSILVEGGYPALSITALAQAANVSPQTIYNSIGGKAEVLKACYDVTLAGDDEPVPMNERPEFQAMLHTPSAVVFIERYAAWCRTVFDRVAGIIGAVSAPGVGDAGAQAFAETIEAERRLGTTRAMGRLMEVHGLREGLPLERAVDVAWTLNSPEVYDRLVRRCGWSPAEYERWLAQQLEAALV
ncbi:MAG: TetR/AcrR family transcriptional regulator [Propionibacteriaceae bacterium]|nr:TetR/AcrR family transcriptional regulator [Propionibacteriaceae bacterium]